jgi:hypothetical protein
MQKISFMVCLLPLLASSCVHLLEPGSADQQLAALLMERSGLNAQLEQVPRIMQTVLEKGRAQDPELKELSQARIDRLAQGMAFAFDAASLKENVQRRLLAGLSEGDMQAALKWLDSPQGRMITVLEEAAATPEYFEERQEGLRRTMGDADRILLLRKLDSAIGGTESAINASLATQIALVTALTSELPQERRPSQKEIFDTLEKSSPDWRETAERQTLQYFLDIYRTLSDEELDLYVRFSESVSGQKYHALIVQAVMDAMLQASHRLERELMQKSLRTAPTGEQVNPLTLGPPLNFDRLEVTCVSGKGAIL